MNTSITYRFVKTMLFLGMCTFLCVSSSWATLVTWNLNPSGASADVGSATQDFTVSGYTITARGYDNNAGTGIAHELHFKNDGTDEIGLGLTNTANYELQVSSNGTPLQFIQLDIRSILSQGFTNGKIEIGSVQSGELFNLYGSNTLGMLGTKLNATPYDSSKDDTFVSVPNYGSFQFISVVSAAADCLPVAFQATIVPIPEAASLVPAVCLIFAVTAFEARRRRRRQKE
jgi:hypothetical protein